MFPKTGHPVPFSFSDQFHIFTYRTVAAILDILQALSVNLYYDCTSLVSRCQIRSLEVVTCSHGKVNLDSFLLLRQRIGIG